MSDAGPQLMHFVSLRQIIRRVLLGYVAHTRANRHELVQIPLTSQLESQLQRLERELEVVKQNEEALRRNYNAMQVILRCLF